MQWKNGLRIKLISAGAFVLFVTAAWSYFKTPDPPIQGLIRPKIDRKLFEGGPSNPAAEAAKKRTDQRKELLEQRKNIRAGGQEENKGGFLSRLLHRNKGAGDKNVSGQNPTGAPQPLGPARIQKRDTNLGQSKRDFLTKRREERKARREALTNQVRNRSITQSGAARIGSADEGGVEEPPPPDEPPPPEPEAEEPPPEETAPSLHDEGASQ